MPKQYSPDFIPETRTEALSLLRAVDDNIDALTSRQRLKIRSLYFIDGDCRSVEQIIRDGELHE